MQVHIVFSVYANYSEYVVAVEGVFKDKEAADLLAMQLELANDAENTSYEVDTWDVQ